MKQQNQQDCSSESVNEKTVEQEKNKDIRNQKSQNTDQPVQDSQSEISELETLKATVQDKDREIKELSDKHLRLMAEYDNFRRRSQKEREAVYDDSVADVIREWLPVLDNLDRAEFSANQYQSEEARHIAEGITMTRKQAYEIMDKLGVQSIECCGQPFDPNLHDAVMHVEDETVGTSTVVEEFKKGYIRKDRVIRHSVVKVAN